MSLLVAADCKVMIIIIYHGHGPSKQHARHARPAKAGPHLKLNSPARLGGKHFSQVKFACLSWRETFLKLNSPARLGGKQYRCSMPTTYNHHHQWTMAATAADDRRSLT
jgi:hypothetical protein